MNARGDRSYAQVIEAFNRRAASSGFAGTVVLGAIAQEVGLCWRQVVRIVQLARARKDLTAFARQGFASVYRVALRIVQKLRQGGVSAPADSQADGATAASEPVAPPPTRPPLIPYYANLDHHPDV